MVNLDKINTVETLFILQVKKAKFSNTIYHQSINGLCLTLFRHYVSATTLAIYVGNHTNTISVSSSLLIAHSGFNLEPRRRGSQKAHGVKMAAMFRGRPCLCEVFLTVF